MAGLVKIRNSILFTLLVSPFICGVALAQPATHQGNVESYVVTVTTEGNKVTKVEMDYGTGTHTFKDGGKEDQSDKEGEIEVLDPEDSPSAHIWYNFSVDPKTGKVTVKVVKYIWRDGIGYVRSEYTITIGSASGQPAHTTLSNSLSN